MPSNRKQAKVSLEIPELQDFKRLCETLNDRFRRIETLLGQGGTVTNNSTTVITGGVNIDPDDFGALGDGKFRTDGAIAASSATFTSATAGFAAGDVGKLIAIAGAGPAGVQLNTTIAGFTDATTVTLTASASTTVSGAHFDYGTDNTAIFQAAIDSLPDAVDTRITLTIKRGYYKLNGTLALGLRRVTFLLRGSTLSNSESLVSITPGVHENLDTGGGCNVVGVGRSANVVRFTGNADECLLLDHAQQADLRSFTLRALGPTAGHGIKLYASHGVTIESVEVIGGFARSIWCSGVGGSDPAYERTNTLHLRDIKIREYGETAFYFDHVEEVFINDVQTYIDSTTAAADGRRAMIIDTHCFAIYGQNVSLIGGGVQVKWTPNDTNNNDLPPNWLFFDNLLADAPWGHPCLELHSSLMESWNLLPPRGYRFANCWFAAADYVNPAATDVNPSPNPCVLVAGGIDVQFSNCKIRAGKGHGIHVANTLGDLRFDTCEAYACWFNNVVYAIPANGAGLYIDAAVGAVSVKVDGGLYSAEGSDIGGWQQYGIYNASTAVHLQVIGVDLHGNRFLPINLLFGDKPVIWGNYYGSPAYDREAGIVISAATATSPVAITTATNHGWTTGQIAQSNGAFVSILGAYKITVTGPNTLTLDGSGGVGTFIGGTIHRIGFSITNVTLLAGNIIEVTTAQNHGWNSGDRVENAGVGGITETNGQHPIAVTAPNKFALLGVTGTGAYTSGGQVIKLNSPIQFNRIFNDQVRMECGDANFYLDNGSLPGSPVIGFDAGDYLQYYRSLNRLDLVMGGNALMRLGLFGTDSITYYNRPSSSGGLDQPWLSSSLDADAGERFGITGRGEVTWGDGTVVDVLLKRLAASALGLTGRLGIEVPTVSARLHIAGGTGITGYVPIKLAPGVLLSSVEDGSLEYDGGGLYFSIGGTRRRISPIGGTLGLQIQVKGTGTTAETLDLYDIDDAKAFSILTITGVPSNGNTVLIDTTTYTFVNTLTGANQVQIAPTKEECLFNLYCAINDVSVWEGYLYGTGTTAHGTCEAEAQISATMKVKFRIAGAGGNGTDVGFTGPFSWSADPMSGGAAATAPHKFMLVQDGALTVKDNAFNTQPIWQLYDNGDMRLYGGNTIPPADINFGIYGRTVIRFAQGGTEEPNSGSIQHGGLGSALNLVGLGSSGSNRVVRIWDHLGIGSAPPVTGAGALAVAGWIGVGTASITSGKIFEVVGGTAKFHAGVEIVGTLNMPSLTADTLLGLDSGKNVVSAAVLPLAVSSGGTGATTAGGALSNLGAAAASHGHNVSDISGGASGTFVVDKTGGGSHTFTFSGGVLTGAS